MPIGDTAIGGAGRDFPTTCWSMLVEARDPASPECRRAVNDLCTLYWKPVYAYIRSSRSYGNEDAKDLAQEFFIEMIDGNLLQQFSPDRGSFRGYLRGALHYFLIDRHRRNSAQKRGGGRLVVNLNDEDLRGVDVEATQPGSSPEEVFEQQWTNSVLDHALVDLRRQLSEQKKGHYYRIFEKHDLKPVSGTPPTYGDLAKEFQVSETDVTNYLAYCRRELRDRVMDRIRAYVGSETEVVQELARILSR